MSLKIKNEKKREKEKYLIKGINLFYFPYTQLHKRVHRLGNIVTFCQNFGPAWILVQINTKIF